MLPFNRVTETAIRAAIEAGEIAHEGFRSPGLRARQKQDMHDIVTRYDLACEQRIREVILADFPDATILGEETGEVRGSDAFSWYVDPIDGTSNFARGIAMWAVSIGVARDGTLIAGVIVDPVAGHVFWADERGAFLRTRIGAIERGERTVWGEDRPLRSTGHRHAGEATVALNFPLARDLVHFPDLALEQFAQVTRSFAQVRGLGSTCITLAWIAAGWLDATISFETHPWDVAAGAFIIRQAGGEFLGYRAGSQVSAEVAHLAPHYYAGVAEGEFALLHEIMRSQSMRPETFSHRVIPAAE